MLNSTEHDIYPTHNVKMSTVDDILAFNSRVSSASRRPKSKQSLYFSVFSFYELSKCHAQLSWAWNKLYNLNGWPYNWAGRVECVFNTLSQQTPKTGFLAIRSLYIFDKIQKLMPQLESPRLKGFPFDEVLDQFEHCDILSEINIYADGFP